jgi:hypothetical protein
VGLNEELAHQLPKLMVWGIYVKKNKKWNRENAEMEEREVNCLCDKLCYIKTEGERGYLGETLCA